MLMFMITAMYAYELVQLHSPDWYSPLACNGIIIIVEIILIRTY